LWIGGGRKVLELATDIREASLEKGGRCPWTNMMASSRLEGKKHDTSNEEDKRDGRSAEVWR
jgi:hypothetical protein